MAYWPVCYLTGRKAKNKSLAGGFRVNIYICQFHEVRKGFSALGALGCIATGPAASNKLAEEQQLRESPSQASVSCQPKHYIQASLSKDGLLFLLAAFFVEALIWGKFSSHWSFLNSGLFAKAFPSPSAFSKNTTVRMSRLSPNLMA